jgi:ABC-2 type transport system permease protein
MKLQLQIEWMKLKNYRAFWILGALYLVSIGGINYITFRVQQTILAEQKVKNMAQMMIGDPPYSFPQVWQMTGFVSSFLLFIPGLLMIMSVTNEYSYKTHRQNVIDGLSRREFIFSKILLAVALTLVSTIIVVITAAIFGFAEGSNEFSFEHFEYIGYFSLQALSYLMVALLISILVKRGALAIGIFFMYGLVIENVLSVVLNRFWRPAGDYLPLQSTDELLPMPFLYTVKAKLFTPPNTTVLLILSLVYLATYFIVTTKKFQKDDL